MVDRRMGRGDHRGAIPVMARSHAIAARPPVPTDACSFCGESGSSVEVTLHLLYGRRRERAPRDFSGTWCIRGSPWYASIGRSMHGAQGE